MTTAFYWVGKSYLRHYVPFEDPLQDEIMIGVLDKYGHWDSCFKIKWLRKHGEEQAEPVLFAYQEEWPTVLLLQEVLRKMTTFTEAESIPSAIVTFLRQEGFRDITSYNHPEPPA